MSGSGASKALPTRHFPLPLPGTRFELTDISHRRVSSLGHIYFGYNYYSVPYTLVGKALRTESNGRLLRVYEEVWGE